MLHEMIMCLLGYVGGLFQLKIENNKTKIKLVENLDYLHPGEVEICNKLAEIGNFYRRLCEFYDTYSFGKSIDNQVLKEGMYLRSFCDALDTVVLGPYRQVISQLEMDLLKDRFNNIMYLQTHLENYYFIFSALDNLTNEILNKKLHGCQILDLIYKHTISGNYEIKAVFNQILTLNLHVMYKQLREWMLYGNLNDKHGEFFISIKDSSSSSTSSTTSSTLSLATTTVATGTGGGSSSGFDEESDFVDDIFSSGSDRFASSSFTQFTINSQLPSFISTKTASNILFNGDLLQLFKSTSLIGNSSDGIDDETVGQFSMLSIMNISMNRAQTIQSGGKFFGEESEFITKNMDELSKKILALSREEHSIVKFDSLVAEIRDYTSEAVWHLVVEKYNLLEEFQKIKDMYLIGRGELFATFLESSKALLNKNIDQNFEYNINYMFQKSVSRMLLDNEAWLSKFRVVLNEENLDKKSQTGWSRIGLSYRVEWPFHSLITRKVIKKLSEIFNYLISIRRVQIELNQCFLIQMRLGTKKLSQTIEPKIWQTRNHMSFIIDNLQFYLQADVLETQFAELENNIKKSKDFDQIRRARDNFLNKIQSQSFMLNKIVLLNFNSIMDLCVSFSSILISYEEEENLEKNKAALEEIIQSFKTQTSLLYKTLRSIEKRQMGSHLEQLLTRINFNNYMEEHEGNVGL